MKRGGRALLITKDESHMVDTGKDFHSKNGIIKASQMKTGRIVKTHLGKRFAVVKPTIRDILEKSVKRTAQVILPKDISLILAYTGITNDSLVVDAGTGTGYTAIFLANYVANGTVVTYEIDKEFAKNAKRNIKESGLLNIKPRQGDVTKSIKERNVDLVVLDLQNAHKAIGHAYDSLKLGGYLVVYSPTVDHLMNIVKVLRRKSFIDVKTMENIVREWQTERTVRPKTLGLMHTGFLTFARKL